LVHYDLVLRPAPQTIPGSGDGRAGTNADPVLQVLAEDSTRQMVPPTVEELRGDEPRIETNRKKSVDDDQTTPLKSASRGGRRATEKGAAKSTSYGGSGRSASRATASGKTKGKR
jgi:hypothetical protein